MSTITIARGGRQGSPAELRTGTFVGEVWGDPVLPATGGWLVNNVHFAPGGRTNWHTHGVGQVLIVTAGEGFVFDEHGNGGRIGVGDVVHIPGETQHWHGATSSAFMTHTAISVGGHDWGREVTADEYRQAHDQEFGA
ncbi:cupin domain-containing protein [Rhodococcus sp. BP-349]|jgi:quercetin dioxygenase-like cupin family protein|uniref:Quercetin dioxygenase-like cupin family protein n=1 Tax=Rhodococcoides corynebacterioides TaxID=53972 RepID=A0ABS2KZS0_9NOCA|nr:MULTISPECIES: cupin domain-containing protein [Rhodococcus]MBM7417423.1 quercetin dioxygenase-like cupin family protein [Rhodococcus corynebacterioides]MBP1115677.1 quercetin dioxygenase-like cupin family protein [Rhodococcus sp. PvP016]MBY6537737.1 cupin domain-containing protein [Rhodococcus sp. BP-363]MBY6542074.1 cupin domain-containing protein [Rhodococcus sp. BP-369]MBY6561304.1 cupin domain-containing protein [Rhodococcus sp. BP-370]